MKEQDRVKIVRARKLAGLDLTDRRVPDPEHPGVVRRGEPGIADSASPRPCGLGLTAWSWNAGRTPEAAAAAQMSARRAVVNGNAVQASVGDRRRNHNRERPP